MDIIDDDEVVVIKGLYAYVNMSAYRAHIRRWTVNNGTFTFSETDMPVRVSAIYPARHPDPTRISICTPRGSLTSFPIDLIERYTNITPEWDKAE